jgi:hypothetical protein
MDERMLRGQLRSLVDDGAPPVDLDEVITGDSSARAGAATRDRRAWYLGAAAAVVAIALIAAVLIARDVGEESVTTDDGPPPVSAVAEPVLVLTWDERVVAVAVSDDAVYVAVNRHDASGASLLQLHRDTLEVKARHEIPETDRYELPSGHASVVLSLAVSDGRVWIAASDGLNARLLKLEEDGIAEVDLLRGESEIAVWNGDLYVTSEPGVQRRDVVTGEVLATITAGSIGFERGRLAAGDDALYKTSAHAGVVQAIRDDDTISTLWDLGDRAPWGGAIAFADGRLIVSAGGELLSLDPVTGEVLASQPSSGAETLVPDGSTVWVMYADLVRRNEVAELSRLGAVYTDGPARLNAGAVLEPGVLLACGAPGCFRVLVS